MSPENISVSWYTSLDDNHPSMMTGQWVYSFISLLFVLNLFYMFYIFYTLYTLYMLHAVYTVYIWYMVYVYMCMYVCVYIYIFWFGCWLSVKKRCSLTIEVWPYATSGLSFWHRKAAREPKGDTAPLENGVLGQLLESGKFAENAEGLQIGEFS